VTFETDNNYSIRFDSNFEMKKTLFAQHYWCPYQLQVHVQ